MDAPILRSRLITLKIAASTWSIECVFEVCCACPAPGVLNAETADSRALDARALPLARGLVARSEVSKTNGDCCGVPCGWPRVGTGVRRANATSSAAACSSIASRRRKRVSSSVTSEWKLCCFQAPRL